MEPISQLPTTIAERYSRVQERIARAALCAGREPDEIRLVTVTKGQPVEKIRQVIAAGGRLLGENYVEEALPKMEAIGNLPGLAWHMVGHVQSRKAQEVSQAFAMVHSLDSARLAARLERFAAEKGRKLPVLLECNVSGEASKFGWPAWDESRWGELAGQLAPLASLPNLSVGGLMTMAPFFDRPEQARPYFARLRRLCEFLQNQLPGLLGAELSMGMSGDFEAAIQEGATIVRIGTAILGPRPG